MCLDIELCKKCPLCNTPKKVNDIIYLSQNDEISLPIICQNYIAGCIWSGNLTTYEYHLGNECQFENIKCIQCNEIILRKNKSHHVSKECPYTKFHCKYCNKIYLAKNKKNHVAVKCPHENCDSDIALCILKSHIGSCSYKKVKCVSCKQFIIKNKMALHRQNECPHRYVICDACEHKYKLSSYYQHKQLKKCQLCNEEIFGCAQQKHNKICKEHIVVCEFDGCDMKYKYSDKDKHNKEYMTLHISLINQHIKEHIPNLYQKYEKISNIIVKLLKPYQLENDTEDTDSDSDSDDENE